MPPSLRATIKDCPYKGPHFMFPRQKFSRENFCLGRQSFMVALNEGGIDALRRGMRKN